MRRMSLAATLLMWLFVCHISNAQICVKPIYIPNTVESAAPDASTACNSIPPQIMFDPATGQPSTWMKNQAEQGIGLEVILKGNVGQTFVSSQYYALDFGDGGATYFNMWANCNSNPLGAFPVKTGDMVGPTKQGVEAFINFPNEDTWLAPGMYLAPDGSVSSTSRSIAVVPVWDNCAQPIYPGTDGQQVNAIACVQIFVDGLLGKNVVVHILGGSVGCN